MRCKTPMLSPAWIGKNEDSRIFLVYHLNYNDKDLGDLRHVWKRRR